ncbi:unnamed protein product [Leptidea sinapis]|uniref:Uncharacterized protein n=1 Tax=Leptidea sinapis TaxID=189913 RepID=A0A5E4R9Q4_9NEOP|nr:unnamed protein product [Leptidea sinapis]
MSIKILRNWAPYQTCQLIRNTQHLQIPKERKESSAQNQRTYADGVKIRDPQNSARYGQCLTREDLGTP